MGATTSWSLTWRPTPSPKRPGPVGALPWQPPGVGVGAPGRAAGGARCPRYRGDHPRHGRLDHPARTAGTGGRSRRTRPHSEYESWKIRERTLRGLRANLAAGKPHGEVPFGYRREHDAKGRPTGQYPDPEEAELVRELFERVRAGHSLKAISRNWSARGIVGRRGHLMQPTTLRSMLQRRAYIGELEYAPRSLGRASSSPRCTGRWTGSSPRRSGRPPAPDGRSTRSPTSCAAGCALWAAHRPVPARGHRRVPVPRRRPHPHPGRGRGRAGDRDPPRLPRSARSRRRADRHGRWR